MGFGSLLRKAGNLVKTVGKVPGVGLIPGVGTALSVAGAVGGLASLTSSGRGGGLPMLPTSGGLPALPGGIPATMGQRSIFRNDPNTIAALKPFAIAKADLRVAFRAPKGFVVVRDEKGDPMGIPKNLARKFFGWKPAPKPFLTGTEMRAIRRTHSVIKKFKKIEGRLKAVANFRTPKRGMREIVIEQPGKRVVGRKVA